MTVTKLLRMLALTLLCTTFTALYAADGDVFTAKTVEGVDMTFKVISETDKTCQVGEVVQTGGEVINKPAIDKLTIGAITIPNNVNGYSVTRIAYYAFYRCKDLTSIVIPNSVITINPFAFEYCSSLTSITIPNSVTSIYAGAFMYCSSLESVTIGSGVNFIGSSAFYNCTSLTSVTIYSSALSTGGNYDVFNGCGNLKSVMVVVTDYSAFCNNSVVGVLFTYTSKRIKLIDDEGNEILEYIVPNDVTSIGNNAFHGCLDLKSVSIGNKVISIGEKAFYNCNGLTSISIPNNVSSIGSYAFYACHGLTSVTIGNGVTNIGNNAFASCNSLTSVTIPNSITSLEQCTFEGCSSLTSVTIPNSVLSIEGRAFASCKGLTSITIPNSVTSIGGSAFYNCSGLTSVTIPNSVTSIGGSAFQNCSGLKKVIVSDIAAWCGIKFGDNFANPLYYAKHLYSDENAEINDLVIPNSVTCIGSYTFNYCSGLSSVIIPSNVTSIGYASFEGCTGFRSIEIPNSISSIDKKAFYGCSNLSSVLSKITNPKKIDSSVFEGIPSNAILQVPKGTREAYTKTDSWGTHFQEIIEDGCCNMTIKVTGMGKVSYNNNDIRDKSITFSVEKGESATLSIIPDVGYKIKKLLVNGYNRTSYVSNNQYTINSISANTNVEAEFEAKPPTTYTLSIKATGNGTVSYGEASIKGKTSTFTVNEGTSVSISLTPDDGYKVKSLSVNNTDVTANITDNQYTISSINGDTNVEVTFEAKPFYSLSIDASGNGNAYYSETTIRNQSQSFTIQEDASATVTFKPDDCYRVKSLVVNDADVTSKVVDNSYTINEIKANTKISVSFEIITHTVTIKSSGNGSATYNDSTIREGASSFTINEGTSATISFTPDEGYRIKCVKVNESDVTSNIENNKYTINNIREEITIDVEFEAIPTYSLNIVVSGNGSASYNGTTIRDQSKNFTVFEGSSPVISITPDSRNRIKNVEVNNVDVTSSVVNNQYTISNINANTNVKIEFEPIPPTTYTLSIKATDNGTVSYGDASVKGKTSTFTVTEGSAVTITLTPDDGYRVKSLVVNNTDVTSSISNNQYTISSINANTSIVAEFEVIIPTTYTLSIKASGNGSVRYGDTSVRIGTKTFTVIEGTSADLIIIPDEAHLLKSFVLNNTDVTSKIVDNKYTISNVNNDITVEVEFKAIETLTYDGMEFKVSSTEQKEVVVANGDYGLWIEVPETVSAYNLTWSVTGFEDGAFESSTGLAAVIWNPQVKFKEKVTNPNLLLYVKSADYAPTEVKNVIVNGKARSITLNDAESDNNFYCPQEFTAENITYEHNYSMNTGYSTCQGWETIVLPFDVAVVTNNIGTELVPYPLWSLGDSKRPFWLCSMNEDGWKDESAIKANTPYIISMPNNDNYDATYNISGNIVFSASNVTVQESDNLISSKHGHRNLVPNYQNIDRSSDIYALNVNNLWSTNTDSNLAEGSAFVRDSRQSRPFEAYMTIDSGGGTTRSINIFDDNETTGIMNLPLACKNKDGVIRVYSLSGMLLKQGNDEKILNDLPKGVYVVNGKKIVK